MQSGDRMRELVLLGVLVGVPALVVAVAGGQWYAWLSITFVLLALWVVGRNTREPEYGGRGRTFVRDYDQGAAAATTIAVGANSSPAAAKVLSAAIELAESSHARLVVISAYSPESDRQLRREQRSAPVEVHWAISPTSEVDEVLEWAARTARARGLSVTTVAAAGHPAEVLCRVAAEQHADVLVIGSDGIHRRSGSVPGSVARAAPCSVKIVETT